MGKYENDEWYINSSKVLIEKYGDIPPPWIYAPNYHPYSMGWRMGNGESHIMILGEWLEQKALDFNQRVKYLQKYPPPPRWYQWVVDFLWEVDSWEFDETEFKPYFEKLEQLGFKHTANFENDLNREDLD